MAEDNLKKHLDAGRYGSPKINPDEQREYLGTFRERCLLSMTIKEMRDKDNEAGLLLEIQKEPTARLLINGAISTSLQQRYMSIATKQNIDFTIVSDAVADNDSKIGLLVVADYAVNLPVIDVEEKYPELQKDDESEKPKEKSSFWNRLFK
ncbi:YueI family protein [Enterococcus sp. 669A]|uniref:YueI family protein n=1 Tax=Candidatus Enterococcus moelleringii TaxID=2815325 RepID=A0ABS3LFV3_9ENTE|nr:YueI family protein [Enterococcus sp. 669A]MBO1308500.1 YueI family protein [Enterococcus sp. 669A]